MSSKNSNKLNIPEAKAAMNKFKMEAASEVGVNLKQGYNGNIFHSRAEETKGQGTCRPWCSFCAIYLQKYLIAFSVDLI